MCGNSQRSSVFSRESSSTAGQSYSGNQFAAHCKRSRNCSASGVQLSTLSPLSRIPFSMAWCSSSSEGLASGCTFTVNWPIRDRRSAFNVPWVSSHSIVSDCCSSSGHACINTSISNGNANKIRASGDALPCSNSGAISHSWRPRASSASSIAPMPLAS